ncbi:MAG: 50S ribosomal protein L21 [Planctomycetes bacterium]|nr:50S ribosomal protein L21 [Planctomycetota bacterium]
MFAIFEDGSHQYRVQAGDRLEIDYRESAKTGDSLSFDRILAAGDETSGKIGRPVIEGATVQVEVVDELFKGKKLEIGKFRRRKGHIRHNGHTQKYTRVRVTAIDVPGYAKSEPAPAPAAQPAATPASA